MPLDGQDTELIMREGLETRKELKLILRELKETNQTLRLLLTELQRINFNTKSSRSFVGGGK